MLHVTNGDIVARRLRAARVPGDVVAWREVLHEGPVPTLPSDELRAVRARFLADAGWVDYQEALAALGEQEAALSGADEVVLWLERDLFDELILVQVVERLGGRRAALVDLGEPADSRRIDVSAGMREAEPLGEEARGLARRAWSAFTAADPSGLAGLLREDTGALPWLGAALRRLLEELPWTGDGLARSERAALAAVDGGARSRHAVFAAHQEMEERPFMGDVTFWARLDRLAGGRTPLLADDGGLRLTEAGADVLASRADAVRLNGIDRWLGGTQLRGNDESPWRWDGTRRQLAGRGA